MVSNPTPQTPTPPQSAPQRRLIKQAELKDYAAKCQHLSELTKEVKAIVDEVIREGLMLESHLRNGAKTEVGRLTLGINETPGKRNIEWKKALAEAAGADYVDQLQRNTLPGPASVSLIIMEGQKIVGKSPTLRKVEGE